MSGVVVVGAGLGGLRVVENLRRLQYPAPITLVGAERHPPYDRPPLTKDVLRGERDSTVLRDDLHALDVDLLLDVPAVGLDVDAHTVELGDGRAIAYDTVVLATGGRARTLPGYAGLPGLHVIRTIDDALALRAAATLAGAMTIIGGGFIGCEVASSLRAVGVEVDLVEVLPLPLWRVLGPVGARLVADLLESNGVTLHCDLAVAQVLGDDHVDALVLSDGTRLAAREVLAGLGIVPDVGWLDGSGVEVQDGIVCDAVGRTSAADVFAVGDAARWYQPRLGEHRRLEHWTSTHEQAATVASAIAGSPGPEQGAVPYFWSDQFGVKIQALGYVDPADEVRRLEVNGRTVLLYVRDGVLRSAVGFSAARSVMRMRGLIAAGAGADEAEQLLRA